MNGSMQSTLETFGTWCVVALAFGTVGAQCGHESANGSEESAAEQQKGPQQPRSPESSEASETEPSDESAESSSSGGDDMERAEAKRVEPEVSDDAIEAIVQGNTTFGLDLYQQLRSARASENLFYSPHNLSSVLAMVYAGAKGETRTQLGNGLHFPSEKVDLHAAFNGLDRALEIERKERGERPEGKNAKPRNVMNTANGVWTQQDFEVEQPYLDLLAQHYGAGVHKVDFRGAPESARTRINDWAEQETEGKIQDLIPKGAIEAQTRLVLTAAIYFRGRWQSPFDEGSTTDDTFTTLSGEQSDVEMMYKKSRDAFGHAGGENYDAVELPYGRGEYSMVVILPDEGSFESVEKELDRTFVGSVFDDLGRRAVELKLPKFELTAQFSAREHLSALGVKKPFTRAADFSGMTTEQKVFVDDVLHKAYVSVDEKGTEAAAASAATMRATSLQPQEPDYEEVTVDRPFLFVIRHRDTDAVLFVGRVVRM